MSKRNERPFQKVLQGAHLDCFTLDKIKEKFTFKGEKPAYYFNLMALQDKLGG